MANELYNLIPGLRAAAAQERLDRGVAALGFGRKVAGVNCRALTLRDVVKLDCVGSPFICGKRPGSRDIWVFLELQRERTLRDRIAAMLAPREAALREIREFIDDAFIEAGEGAADEVVYWHLANDFIHIFGNGYGWSVQETMDSPIALLFLQCKVIRRSSSNNAIMFNPLSDAVRGEWLRKQNEAN